MTQLVNTQVKNNKTESLTGLLGGDGAAITWSGTVTDDIAADGGVPYFGDWNAYFGTMEAVAALLGATTWSNAALTALGAPLDTVGLGEWGDQLNTTSVDTIAYAFSAPVPAGDSFTLVDPGASYVEYSGSETYTISATYNGAAVSTSGWTFQIQTPTGAATASNVSIDAATGVITVSGYAGKTWPDSILVITPNTPITGIQVTANTIPFDFWSLDLPHLPSAVLFEAVNLANQTLGSLASWEINNTTYTGGGVIGNVGTNYVFTGTGDFFGDGGTDVLWRNQDSELTYWELSGASIYSSGEIAFPNVTWNVVGIDDFNDDGRSDILFEDMSGALYIWEMNGAALLASVNLGNPGSGWRYLATGEFAGPAADAGLLFENTGGVYAEWQLANGNTIASTIYLGAAPAGYVFAATADLTGSGQSDIVFRNPATGQYLAWFLSPTGIASTSVICTPGIYETLVAVGTYTSSAAQDLLFENSLTGTLSDYVFAGGALASAGDLYSAEPYWAPALAPYADPVKPPPTIFFANASGYLATWTVPNGVIQSHGVLPYPGAGWSYLASGDFYGMGTSDILFENTAGQYAIWQTKAGQFVAGAGIGTPGAGWTFAGVGDFNGDGCSDVLFESTSGAYVAWLMDGATYIGGGPTLANPGPGETLVGIGDLTGDGTSDLIFAAQDGSYEVCFIANDTYVGTAAIGNAGPGWSFAGVGDFNGAGHDGILLQNTNGNFAVWDMDGSEVIGGGQFQGPGAGWAYLGVSDLSSNRDASVLFKNASTRSILAYNLYDASPLSTTTIGTPGGTYSAVGVI